MHPLTVVNQVNGKDKIARFIQYLCRALWYSNKKISYTSADKYKAIENHFSTFRKILRFGRCLESFYYASKSVHQEDVIKKLNGLIKISHGCFLFCDHLILMNRLNVLKLKSEDWTLSASRYWFLTDVLNLIQNYYELRRVHCSLNDPKKENSLNKRASENSKLLLLIYLDIIKNLCDMFLPLYALGSVNINPGTTGILGMISSFLGLISLIFPR